MKSWSGYGEAGIPSTAGRSVNSYKCIWRSTEKYVSKASVVRKSENVREKISKSVAAKTFIPVLSEERKMGNNFPWTTEHPQTGMFCCP